MKTIKKGILAILLIAAACSGKNNADDAANVIEALKAKPVQKEITTELITSLKDNELEQVIYDNLEYQLASDNRE
ncbi:MAG TPA: hypothetical protein PLR06_11910, partial [Cyclobacteriaceae bacterium]|nr:hypothetical protein [Cyclobacteriaceae bacterium]